MIFESAIKQYTESRFELPTELDIIREYYENEISFLEMVLEYKDTVGSVNESYVEAIHEGFVNNLVNKIKEIIKKFIDWIKDMTKKVIDKLLSEESFLGNKLNKNKKNLNNAKTDSEVEASARNASVKMEKSVNETYITEDESSKYVIYRYDIDNATSKKEVKMLMDDIDFKWAKKYIKELDNYIEGVKRYGEEKLSDDLRKEMEESIESIKEEMKEELAERESITFEDIKKDCLERYELNGIDELQKFTAEAMEKDTKDIKLLYNIIRRLKYNIKTIDDNFMKIQNKINTITDDNSRENVELAAKFVNAIITYVKSRAEFYLKLAYFIRSLLKAQIK